ncbi:MAG TPA: S9 family peptidase [Candidatus Angelobacter sp.]|nr:S9 family peptidase [Candidatus Angelobacter sp.]
MYTLISLLTAGVFSVKHRLSLILLATTLCAAAAAQQLTIQSIYSAGPLNAPLPDTIKWSPDGAKVSYIVRGEQGEPQLYSIDIATGKPALLVGSDKLASLAPPLAKIGDEREQERRARYSVAGYHWAPDSKHILFDANGQIWLYSLENGTAIAMSASADPVGDPKFSPDGSRLAYIRNHNLYARPVKGGDEVVLTRDKDENILNGEVDWVYAEELDVRSNYFWSPDGVKIAFLRMDEAQVPTYPIEDFIPTHPTVSQEKYPKVGDHNPEVQVGVLNARGGGLKWIHLTDDKDVYVPRFGWVRPGLLWAMVLNRKQNQLDLYFVDTSNGKSRRVLSETSDTWIDVDDNFAILKSSDKFIWSSWRDGHTHLYLYSFDKDKPLAADARLENQITKGDFEVFSIEALDDASNTVYVTANAGDDRQRHLCSVRIDGSDFQNLTKSQPGTHSGVFAPTAKYYVDTFSTLMTPPQLSFCRTNVNCDVFWKPQNLDAYNLAAPQFVDFKAQDGTLLRGKLFLPAGSAGKKIPLLMNPYGGPHAQTVVDAWEGAGLLFNEILLRDGIAVLEVDNRGMGGRGKKFTGALLRNFGEVELQDQLAALDQALARFPQLDANRLGWWGWSYGGFMTLNAMTHSDRFKAGVAVAPVTDWHDYDSIYTERYEGLVPEFESAYKKNSPINFASHLHGHLLEVHGTSDDNVHMQNTLQMVNAFINSGKQFDLLLYPRKTHGIGGQAARVHLFTRIRDHFRRELLGLEPAAEGSAE